MNETTILLSGDPKAQPDFLATVEPAIPRQPPFTLPFELVFDGYTREPWSSGKIDQNGDGGDQKQQQRRPQHGTMDWQSCYLVSTDGRDRLPGFMKYLQGRKKAAVAKFEATDALPSSSPSKAILVVPHDPPPIPIEQLPDGVDKGRVMFVKYLRDEKLLKKDDNGVRKLHQQKMMAQQQQQQQMIKEKQQQMQHNRPKPQKKIPTQPAPSRKGGGGGLLGNLLGAQRRTENHLHTVRASKSSNDANFDPTVGAAGCINAFRSKISADLETFKSDPATFTTKIAISLTSLVKSVPAEERDRVTMDVFKFAVYEQVEEVGMDKWIAAKEPTGFMDESTITIYKEGHCPPEVMEDINKGEIPDEMKGEMRHLAEAQSKAIQRKGKVAEGDVLKQSNTMRESTILNTNKRDRRTLEEIQRDMHGGDEAKRGRYE